MLIKIKVNPNSRESRIEEIEHKEIDYKVKLKSAPQKGKANQELVEVLSAHFKTPKSRIQILDGYKSRLKTIRIS